MALTSGSKRPSPPPSSPVTPPSHRAKHKRKQETEQEEEAEKPLVKEKYPYKADNDPALETSKETKRKLFSVQDPSRINESVLAGLKCLLLDVSFDLESVLNNINLSEIVASMFETERWPELIDNVIQGIHTNSETRQEMALRVILCLPEKECLLCLPRADKFWSDNYESILADFFRINFLRFWDLFDSPNFNIQALTFDASVKLTCLLPRMRLDRVLLKMVVWLQLAFRRGGQIDIVEPRIMDLVHVARNYRHDFEKSLNSRLMSCMFEIAETADDNFHKCQAIVIIKILLERSPMDVRRFVKKLSEECKCRILDNCVRLMFRIEDVPSWYDMETESGEHMGISGNYKLGESLLNEVCFDTKEGILLSFGTEMIPEYMNSEDWQTRHAGVIAFEAIGRESDPEKIREQTERVVDISLADPHPRVRWAAIEAILSFSDDDSDHDKEHVRFLNKFLPRLVAIIRSSASIYPRVQFHATKAVRHLINNCDNEAYVRSFSEDLVPELLKFLEKGGKFRDEAMEILRLLTASFPVVFHSYYQEIVDSLKPLVSQSLLGAKSIESLSYIFSEFFKYQTLFLLSDANEVFTIVFKILDDWTDTDNRVKIHILKALFQLCKLQQTDKFLNKTMPVLIQILKNTNDSTMTLTIDKNQILSDPEERILACDLLSNFAVRFQEQFAPWASKVAPPLISLFRNTYDDDFDEELDADAAKIASVNALPSVLLSCQHRKEYQQLINSTVRALVKSSQKESKRAIDTVMLKSLNACIAISGSVFNVIVIKQIAVLINQQVSQESLYANLKHVTDYEMEQEEEIIQAAKCLETMINTLKFAFLPHVDKLLPAVEALWGPDNEYPDKVKEVAISIFNLLLKDYPYKLQRYRDTYPRVVMDFCESESPQLQREAACGIGLCATHRELISNFDALEAINNLYHVIERAMESERRMTYDAAVSALGKICEFRHDTINGPEVVPIWLSFLPLTNDCEEAKYAHKQLCLLLEKADPDLLGLNDENLNKITQILREILLQSGYIATEETTCSIIYLLTQLGAMP
ncbi:hypothetical protein K1719_029639 [Acacia pycnantha]|nr:hypothetical protein K1719_029639 [Acacia pycnantha]